MGKGPEAATGLRDSLFARTRIAVLVETACAPETTILSWSREPRPGQGRANTQRAGARVELTPAARPWTGSKLTRLCETDRAILGDGMPSLENRVADISVVARRCARVQPRRTTTPSKGSSGKPSAVGTGRGRSVEHTPALPDMTKPTVTDTRGRTGVVLRAGVGLDEVTGNSRDERGRDHVDARAWSDRADEIGRWVWVELITREDCYCCYYEKDGQVEVATAKRALTPEVVRGHFQARSANGLIGLHSTVRTTLEGETEESCWSRFGAIDVDAHCENDDPDANWRAAKAWFERARDLGLEPLLIDSNRKGGYHLWIVFESVATEEVYAL